MKKTKEPARLCSAREAADHFRCTTKTLHAWRRKGLIPAFQLPSGHYLFDLRKVEAALNGDATGRES
jgi:DNA-binding transcriptional MerR regulator